jgi:indole-3-glycerol phosphate synthase
MSDILQQILATKSEEVQRSKETVSLSAVREQAVARRDVRAFASALLATVANGQPAIIAEIKKASPSKGVIRKDFDPHEIARSYARGGATCLSVLTDQTYFQGSSDALIAARNACELPVLRKDFVIDPYQVYEARAMGADCILLIVAALDRARLMDLEGCALELGMDVLIEVHDEYELDTALAMNSPLVGVNNRDLRTFEVRLETTTRLRQRISGSRLAITESGINTADDVARMRDADVHAFLVGEAFMRALDPGLELSRLFKR